MASVTVRNVDPVIIERLKDRARRSGRSMEAEIRALLADAVRTRRDALERIDEIRRRGVRSSQPEEVEEWIRGTWEHPA